MDSEIQKASDFSWKSDLNSSPELMSCSPNLHASILFSLLLCSLTFRHRQKHILSLSGLILTEESVLDQSKRKIQACVKFSTFSLKEWKPNFHTLVLGVKFLLSSNIYP